MEKAEIVYIPGWGRRVECPECGHHLPPDGETECDRCGAHLRLMVETIAPAIGDNE